MTNKSNSLTADLLSNNGFIQCNKVLIKALGLEGAALIGELCSEYRYYEARGMLKNEEYFYTTTENIKENIGIGRTSQDNYINQLKNLNIIETKLMGMPCKRYFKINFEILNNFMEEMIDKMNAESIEKYKKLEENKENSEKIDTFNSKKEQNTTDTTDINTTNNINATTEKENISNKQSNQECIEYTDKDVYNKQARVHTINKQECIEYTSKDAYHKQPKVHTTNKQECIPQAPISTNKRMINKNRLTRVYVHTPIYEYESYFSVVDQNIPPTENKELNNLFKEWVNQKLAKKEQITICYLERNIFKVLSFAEENQIPSLIKCLENGWKNIYEVDINTGKINFNLSEKEQKDIEYKDNLIKNTELNNKLKEKQIEQIDTNIKLSKERAENYKQSKQLNDEFKKSRIKEIAYKTQNQNKTQKIENIFNNLNEKLVNEKEREYDNGANNEFNQSYTNILPLCKNS